MHRPSIGAVDIYNNFDIGEKNFMSMDHIFLDGIQASVRIGTTREEQATPQTLMISVRLHLPLEAAGRSDDLGKSIDYAEIDHQIRAAAEAGPYVLVERLAEVVADRLLALGVNAVWVRVEKRVLKAVTCAGVEIWRERK